MQPKHPWLQKCIQKLEELPQIETTTIIEPFLENTLADGLLTIYTPHNKIHQYIVEIKVPITLDTVDANINYIHHLQEKLSNDKRTLLITDALSDEVLDLLLENNIEFIDTTGNIYLNNSSLYILVRSSSTQRKKSKITSSTLKVAYAILQDPYILQYPTLEMIVNVAGVDSKTVKRSLETLYQLNYLQRQRNGTYRIENYTKLLERWEMGYIENLRPELLIGTFSTRENIDFNYISEQILEIAQNQEIIIGGELGAAILTGYLKPINMTIHIPEEYNYRTITTMLRLKPDPKGNIIILKQFGNKNQTKYYLPEPVADPLLIHTELCLYPDERLKETAKRLYEKYIITRQEIAEMV
ncbi:type IV toxin-antitoxin system AbiEi family antitoxin [Dolichospermum circinale]|uniref:type IV toxin-antitoxin system AbiEi family antitoxin n=1 Tax=Dolichospermum circinale TaxID=109265 RepID=UPI00042A3540|nr:type IV toxin-antitoxin system AbiEi family antitoxin [Dolichospermum circinale]MDB9473545.1 type IV toxin-antitoxin system AbiEi family antitoxin [Dolichospermum circinale CS-537/11]MDB9478473.1 type IV toxin-antitoxin system AbiEi family antitoxin [Dolichospermum circinale CS-537/03]MDB9482344.1 type IV toxin-antitoxin system AbiEi family antitoxin [Dolichospermum circinale CS-537/05]